MPIGKLFSRVVANCDHSQNHTRQSFAKLLSAQDVQKHAQQTPKSKHDKKGGKTESLTIQRCALQPAPLCSHDMYLLSTSDILHQCGPKCLTNRLTYSVHTPKGYLSEKPEYLFDGAWQHLSLSPCNLPRAPMMGWTYGFATFLKISFTVMIF